MHRFFVYGTLMDPDILATVIDRVPGTSELRPAVLSGWQRRAVRGQHFPMVIPAAGEAVEGLLAGPFAEPEAARLVRFEHSFYELARVEVSFADGEASLAWVFAPAPGVLDPGGPWDFETWAGRDKPAFMSRIASARLGPTQAEIATARRVLQEAIKRHT